MAMQCRVVGGSWVLMILVMCCVSYFYHWYYILPPPRHASRPHIAALLNLKKDICLLYWILCIRICIFVDVSKYFCDDFVSKSNTDTQQNGNEAASTIWRRESCEVGRHTEEMVATFMAPDFYNIYNKMWNILLSLSLSYHHLHPIKICATSCMSSWNTHLEISSHSWTLDSNKIGARRTGPSAKCIF